jgi:hypothetical protein
MYQTHAQNSSIHELQLPPKKELVPKKNANPLCKNHKDSSKEERGEQRDADKHATCSSSTWTSGTRAI